MKKSFLFAGLAVIAALAACNKSEIEVSENAKVGRPVSIFVSPADETKTVNDGLHTKWAEGDALAVFAAEAGATAYGDELQFTLKDAETNKFDGTADLTADAYDWYAFYPYDSHITTPANDAAGYVTLGTYSNNNQTQAGNNSTAHLAGKFFPLYGQVKNVAKADDVVIPMHQAASVVAVNVTNDTPAAITVSKIVFTATESIVGQYFINFVDAAATYTDRTGNVSNVATLVVNEGAEIAAGASATFYIGVKPFTAAAAAELTVKVNATNGEQEIVKAMEAETVFAAGHIKTLNVSYTKVAGAEIEGGWKLVEGAEDLADGLEIIIANADANKAMGTTQNTNNRAAVDLTASDSKKTAEVTEAHQVVTLEQTGDNWYLKVGEDQYLYASGGTKNQLKTAAKATVGDMGIFTITFETAGIPTVKAIDAGTERNWLRYNSGNEIFACYGSGQQDIRFYYKETAAPAPALVKVWGIYGEAGVCGWPGKVAGIEDLDGNIRNATFDDEHVYIPKTKAVVDGEVFTEKKMFMFSLADGSYEGLVTPSIDPAYMDNATWANTFPMSCARVMKNTDPELNGGKDILVCTNLCDGQVVRLYAWVNGVAEQPRLIASFINARRFGDRISVEGTYQEGRVWYRSFAGGMTAFINLVPGYTEGFNGSHAWNWVEPLGATATEDGDNIISEYTSFNKGAYGIVASNSSNGIYLLTGTATTKNYPEYKRCFGWHAFAFEGTDYIAYLDMSTGTDKPIITILEGASDTVANLQATLDAKKVAFKAAFATADVEDFTTGTAYATNNVGECEVRIIDGTPYILGATRGSIALFKLVLE